MTYKKAKVYTAALQAWQFYRCARTMLPKQTTFWKERLCRSFPLSLPHHYCKLHRTLIEYRRGELHSQYTGASCRPKILKLPMHKVGSHERYLHSRNFYTRCQSRVFSRTCKLCYWQGCNKRKPSQRLVFGDLLPRECVSLWDSRCRRDRGSALFIYILSRFTCKQARLLENSLRNHGNGAAN